jgi:outer membrane protein OmpA-like peptidoglycan-associated protein
MTIHTGKRVSRVLSSAVLLALASANVHAAEGGKRASKEQKTGMAAGTVVGALVGGPIGAAAGFIVGTLAGTGATAVKKSKQHTKSVEQQLALAQSDLAKAQERLTLIAQTPSVAPTAGDAMLAELAKQLHSDVMFRTNSAELEASTAERLAVLGGILAAYPNLVVAIDGYADPRGTAEQNLELSQQRASAVRAALMIGGAKSDGMRLTAHGEQLSTAAKGDSDAYAWERRATLSVVAADPQAASQVAQVQ